MKISSLFLNLIILCMSCTAEEVENEIVPNLEGNWQLVEVFSYDGNSGQWNDVDNGYFYVIDGDMTVNSEIFPCDGKIKFLQENEYTLEFYCDDNTYEINVNISLENDTLIIDENCFETCLKKFKKRG